MKRVFLIASLVIIVCLSACASPAPDSQISGESTAQETIAPSLSSQETTAPSASPMEVVYFASDNSYSVSVSKDWQVDNSGSSDPTMMLFTPPIELEGNIPSATFSAAHYDMLEGVEFSGWFMDLIYEGIFNVDMISENTNKSNGIELYRYEFTGANDPNGAQMHYVYCYLVKDSSIYTEAYAAETEMWEEYYPYFEKMMDSFEALSPTIALPNASPTSTEITENSYGYITDAYSKNGKNYIKIDYVDILSGDAAVARALEDGATRDKDGNLIRSDGEIVNTERYIVNVNDKLRTFELSDNCSIQIFGATQMLDVNFQDFQVRLLDFVNNTENNQNAYMFVWIDVSNGLVVTIEESND